MNTVNITNQKVRQEFKDDPKSAFVKHFNAQLGDVDIKVVENTKNVFYMVMPPEVGTNEMLDLQAGAGCVGTASTAGTALCFGSICTCAGTLSSTGSAGTAGTIDTDK